MALFWERAGADAKFFAVGTVSHDPGGHLHIRGRADLKKVFSFVPALQIPIFLKRVPVAFWNGLHRPVKFGEKQKKKKKKKKKKKNKNKNKNKNKKKKTERKTEKK